MTEASEVWPESKIFIQIPSALSTKPQVGTLIFVGEDGRSLSVTCRIEEKSDVTDKNRFVLGYLDEGPKGHERPKNWVSVKIEDYSKLKQGEGFSLSEKNLRKTGKIIEGGDPSILKKESQAFASANRTAYLARMRKIEREGEKGKRSGKLRTRTCSLLTGVLITPIEMLTGVVKLAFSCALVGLGALALLGITGTKISHTVKAKQIKAAKEKVEGFAASAIRQVRIALLQLIPFIGAQLSNQYRETGSLKGFIDAPAVGGFLKELGINVLTLVYGSRSPKVLRKAFHLRRVYQEHPVYKDTAYLSKREPGVEDAKQVVYMASTQSQPQGALVRIPVKMEPGKVRYHDGTMFLSTVKGAPRLDAPTVIMYHGNNMPRDLFLNKKAFKTYLEQGYNVLLASYAGDYVIQGDGKSHKIISTQCTEALMRADAQADLSFLKAFGVKTIGIYGFSLGGAQAMNFAQAVGEEGTMVSFISLNKTFSDGVSVVARAAKNMTGSNLLSRIAATLTRRFFLEETEGKERGGCDCLDNVAKLREIVKKKQFKSTEFTFIGATEDPLMSAKENPENNFAAEMYLAVQEIVGDRAKLILTLKGHQL